RLEKLVAHFPDVPEYGRELARAWFGVSLVLAGSATPPEAAQALGEETAVLGRLAADVQRALYGRLHQFVNELKGTGRTAEAEKVLKHLRECCQQLADDAPNSAAYQRELAAVEGDLAWMYR